jgi:hypothetical protein
MSVEQCWNDNNTGTPKNRITACPSASLYTINPTVNYVGLWGLNGERPANNRPSHGTASAIIIFKLQDLLFYASGERPVETNVP